MTECEVELHELCEQYLELKTKAENDLDKEHKKTGQTPGCSKKQIYTISHIYHFR